ncbi:uncharacterized protein PgNI_11907 [Pyricularia grisea]|uniref:Uncharacterized protein n=1 Tax=Pyricularia grisea TaxID=148305 RepID=A0A6P8AR22_PYRGI|nr:uncharacterized protein PgNI_11907 [Pyricularia grisea]TLD04491.1 hypothetical protein PgNI_11907 [Pyricularia grisea]
MHHTATILKNEEHQHRPVGHSSFPMSPIGRPQTRGLQLETTSPLLVIGATPGVGATDTELTVAVEIRRSTSLPGHRPPLIFFGAAQKTDQAIVPAVCVKYDFLFVSLTGPGRRLSGHRLVLIPVVNNFGVKGPLTTYNVNTITYYVLAKVHSRYNQQKHVNCKYCTLNLFYILYVPKVPYTKFANRGCTAIVLRPSKSAAHESPPCKAGRTCRPAH